MSEFSEFLYGLGEISGETVFIGSTKIEACADKYTFVWKKAVAKSHQKLLDKLAAFVAECETLYGLKIIYKKQAKMKHVKKLHQKLYAMKTSEYFYWQYYEIYEFTLYLQKSDAVSSRKFYIYCCKKI